MHDNSKLISKHSRAQTEGTVLGITIKWTISIEQEDTAKGRQLIGTERNRSGHFKGHRRQIMRTMSKNRECPQIGKHTQIGCACDSSLCPPLNVLCIMYVSIPSYFACTFPNLCSSKCLEGDKFGNIMIERINQPITWTLHW